jgi:PPOX class probable F420-dependent enzyme
VTWVDWDGANVIVNTAHGRAKPRHVRRDPRVAVEVVDRNDAYRYVSVTGTAELVDEGAEEHINKLSHRYRGRDFSYREGERRVMMRIRPERVYAYGFGG